MQDTSITKKSPYIGFVVGCLLGSLASMAIGQYLRRSHDQQTTWHVNANPPKKAAAAPRMEVPYPRKNGVVSVGQPPRISTNRDSRIASLKERTLAAITEKNLPDYQKLFSQLGVDEATSKKLQDRLRSLWTAKVEMSSAANAAMLEEVKYTLDLKQILGDRYAEYDAYETASRSRSEMALINEYLQKKNLPTLSDPEENAVRALIEKYQAYSPRNMGDIGAGGALGEVPIAASGGRAVSRVQAERDHLSASAATAIAEAKNAGLSPAALAALNDYYGTQLGEEDRFLNKARDTIGTEIELWQSVLARMQKDPAADPVRIERVQQKIGQLQLSRSQTTAPNP